MMQSPTLFRRLISSALTRLDQGVVILLGALIVTILATGGWTPHLYGIRISLDRPDNPFLLLLACLALRWWRTGRTWSPPSNPRRAAVGLVAAYVAFFALATATRHLTFRTHAFDLGIFDQVVWNIAQGDGPWSSILGRHFFGEHFSPVLYPIAGLYWFAPSPITLLILQSAALGLGGLLVFELARTRLRSDAFALVFAAVYLLYPPLHGVNLYEFHPIAFTTPLFLAAALALERHQLIWMLLLLGVALLCQEDAALPVSAMGLYLGLRHRRWAAGALVALAGLGLFYVELEYLIPAYRQASYSFYDRYSTLGGAPLAVLRTSLLHPLTTAHHLFTPEKLLYLSKLFAPFLFLPLLGPLELIPALPTLFLNLASDHPAQYSTNYHYSAPIIPFIVWSAASGMNRLRQTLFRFFPKTDFSSLTSRIIFSFLLLLLAFNAPLLNYLKLEELRPTARQITARELLRLIPPHASVGADDPYVPHLSHRQEVLFPPRDEPEYFFIDTTLGTARLVNHLTIAGYLVLAERDGLFVLKRRVNLEGSAPAAEP